MKRRTAITGTIFCGLIIAAMMAFSTAGCSAKNKTAEGAKSGYSFGENSWGAVDPMALKAFSENIKNPAAVKELYEKKAIFPMKEGLSVVIVRDHGPVVEVQPENSDIVLWTFKGMLKEK